MIVDHAERHHYVDELIRQTRLGSQSGSAVLGLAAEVERLRKELAERTEMIRTVTTPDRTITEERLVPHMHERHDQGIIVVVMGVPAEVTTDEDQIEHVSYRADVAERLQEVIKNAMVFAIPYQVHSVDFSESAPGAAFPGL